MYFAMADSVAGLSRRLAQGSSKLPSKLGASSVNGAGKASWGRRVAALLYRYYPAKRGTTTIHDFDDDLTMMLDRASQISSAIYWSGHHSLPLVRFLRDFLTPEMTLVDVGANIGEITLFAAKKLREGRILAFEPMPSVFAQLARNVEMNHFSNAVLFNLGLYHEDGALPLYVKEDKPYGRTNEGVTSLFSSGKERKGATVSLRRLDDVAEECRLGRMDFLKIDVEGAELMVLRGAEGCIRKFRPVIVAEVAEENFRRAGYTRDDLFAFLESLNYEIRALEEGIRISDGDCDALCLPRGSVKDETRNSKVEEDKTARKASATFYG